jgi:hypothetical protein
MRAICLLPTITGLMLLLVPAITTDFSWRYQLPAIPLLPAGAALAFTALRRGDHRAHGAGDTSLVPAADRHRIRLGRSRLDPGAAEQ